MPDTRSPRDRIASAEVRAWARANGWPDLKDRGTLPVEAREAFDAAHDGDGPDDPDGGDVSAMDESDLDDEEVLVGAVVDDDRMPPPSNLDEARERVGRQPGSAHLRKDRRKREPKPDQPPVKVTPAVRKDIEGKVAFWLLIPAEPWRRVDPYCGQAYLDSIEDIALKATPLLCQSPAVVRWFSKSTTFVQVTELAMACRPVAEAVIAHHVTKRIQLDQFGEVVRDRDTGVPVPQGGGVDFSAYSARQPNPVAA
jgi:hypothetical protein